MDCICPVIMAAYQENTIRRDIFFETDRVWEPVKRFYKDQKEGARHRHNCQKVRETVRAYEQHLDEVCLIAEDSLSRTMNASLRSKKEFLQRFMRGLSHACCCQDANCRMPTCIRLKAVISHATCGKCPKPKEGLNSCPTCRQLYRLCSVHTLTCEDSTQEKCPIPFCDQIKADLPSLDQATICD